jgi:hypothetical protein
MNYFDRLVRRALRLPRPRAGQPLEDPFENIAPWPLDPEKPAAARSFTETPRPTPRANVAHSPARAAEPLLRDDAAVAHAAPSRQPVDFASQSPIFPSAAALHAEAAPSMEPPPRSVDPDPAPLREADAFLRSLGVRLPPEAIASLESRDCLTAAPRIAARRAESLERRAVLLPPLPAQPHAVDVPSPHSPSSTAAPERSAAAVETPARPEPHHQDHRPLIVVKAGSTRASNDESTGCGAPHFGLGQL